ncbi:cysteine-type peptidase [Aureococcus anophagefferens]|nr:cysteine-type peptidase [Aureococcus anophagefferens]
MMRALVYALVASLTRAATTTTTNFRGEDTAWACPRERLLVLLAEDPTFDGRNPHRGRVFISANGKRRAADDLAGDWGANATHLFADVDYAGDEVTPELVRHLLTGRLGASTPRSRRLDSGPASNVLVYLTGHGGDEFLKFHDSDELSAVEIADAVAEMRAKGRYGRLVLVADTCQAGSLLARLSPPTTPNVLGVASAKLGENAYAAGADAVVGVALADRFTEHVSKFFDGNRVVGHDAAWGAPDWRAAPLAAFFGSEPTFHLTPWPP